MKNTYGIISACLAMGAGAASGDILALEGTGTIEQFSPSFDGADLFPFVGLNDGDAISFHYQFDTNTLPSSIDGMIATYELDATGSYMQLGESVMTFDSVTMRVGTSNSDHGLFTFLGHNSIFGASAFVGLFDSDPLSMDIPHAIEFDSFTWSRDFYADTDANQFLLPIAFGILDSAQIVPAPGLGSLIATGLLFGLRRRR